MKMLRITFATLLKWFIVDSRERLVYILADTLWFLNTERRRNFSLTRNYLVIVRSNDNRGLRLICRDFLKEFLTRITLTSDRLVLPLPNANYDKIDCWKSRSKGTTNKHCRREKLQGKSFPWRNISTEF